MKEYLQIECRDPQKRRLLAETLVRLGASHQRLRWSSMNNLILSYPDYFFLVLYPDGRLGAMPCLEKDVACSTQEEIPALAFDWANLKQGYDWRKS